MANPFSVTCPWCLAAVNKDCVGNNGCPVNFHQRRQAAAETAAMTPKREHKQVRLIGGGTVTLSVEADFLRITDSEAALVLSLANLIRGYEAANKQETVDD